MQSTTNYGLNIVEGTDIVNPLTQFNPNFTDIDSIMKANADASVDHATCIKTGTVHAITRTNTDANVFRFTATGNWNTGDTMTVDGTLVSVYVSDGTAPSNNCFVINTEVLAAIQGTRVTLYVNSGDASNISFDDTSVSYTANNVQSAIEAASTATGTEYSAGVSVKQKIDNYNVITFSSNANINGAKVEVYEHLDFIIVSFENAEVTANLPATTDMISLSVNAKFQTTGVIYAYSSGGNTFKTIPIYLNKNNGVIRCTDSIPINSTLGGCIIFAKA